MKKRRTKMNRPNKIKRKMKKNKKKLCLRNRTKKSTSKIKALAMNLIMIVKKRMREN